MIDYRLILMDLSLLTPDKGKAPCLALAGAAFDAEDLLGMTSVQSREEYLTTWGKACDAPDMLAKIKVMWEATQDVLSRPRPEHPVVKNRTAKLVDGDYEQLMGELVQEDTPELRQATEALAGAMHDAMTALDLVKDSGSTRESYIGIFQAIHGKPIHEQAKHVLQHVMAEKMAHAGGQQVH